MLKTTAAHQVLSADRLRSLAPSIFADRPWERMTQRYRMVPTIEVVGMLADRGYRPVFALQGGSRIVGKADFTRHMIRFRHDDHLLGGSLAVGDEFPELVMTNSHDGTSAYKFEAGVFRLACLNGMIVAKEDLGSVAVRHAGGADFQERVIDVTYQVMDDAPKTLNQIQVWKGIDATPGERLAFATAAAGLRENDTYQPAGLLTTRRAEDRVAYGREIKPDTWTMSNVVQENVIRGGVAGRNMETGRRTRTREVKSVGENLRLNRAIWQLTEAFARLKGA